MGKRKSTHNPRIFGSIDNSKVVVTPDKITIQAGAVQLDLSPEGYHVYAVHYLEAFNDFLLHDKRSPVGFFLLSLALELEFKSRLLVIDRSLTPKQLKAKYSHDLVALYNDLEGKQQVLSADELMTLQKASDLYGPKKGNKAFEYYQPIHALTAFNAYPDLKILESIALKYIGAEFQRSWLKNLWRLIGMGILALETPRK